MTAKPSRIDGKLRANGNVWLINQNGVTIGPRGQVKAQGFLATTSDIADDDFMQGNYNFNRPSSNPNAKVVNQGQISLGERGLGALVAPHARNDGVIEGKASTVVIAGAETFAVDFYGDGLINFETTGSVTRKPEGVEALAENNGEILVDGGKVLITTDAAEGIIDRVIKVGGKVNASSATRDGGEIVLDGGRSGTVAVTGTLDASSAAPSGRGGKIDIRGRKLAIGGREKKTLIRTSGSAGGGDIRIGARERQGKGPGPNAESVVLAPEARIIADATVSGDGGSIIVYGEQTAEIDGTLTARGGPQIGDGGFIETSGREAITIAADTRVSASASAGKPGTWLIDPEDITIDANNVDSIVTALERGSNVLVTTTAGTTPPTGTEVIDPDTSGFDGGGGVGDIIVEVSIQPNLTTPAGRSLTTQRVTLELIADNDVTISSGVTIGLAGVDAGDIDGMGVKITAGNNITNNGTIDVSAGIGGDTVCEGACLTATAGDVSLGRINVGARNINIEAGGAITDNTAPPSVGDDGGAGDENLVGGNITLTAGSDIGATGNGDIDIVATSINAEITGTTGGVFIHETGAVELGNTVLITPGTVDGSVEVTAGDTMTVTQAITTAGSGDIRLRTRAGNLQVNQAVTAGGDLTLDAAGELLTSDPGTALSVNDGGVLSAGGDISLAARGGDIALGRIDAGNNAISITAGGELTDQTPTDDGQANPENLVGGAVILQAGSSIGASGEADIDTRVVSLDAQAGGDISWLMGLLV